MENINTKKRAELLETAKNLVDAVLEKMEELGVKRLGPVYIENWHNQTHGTQTRLHLDRDESESDLCFCLRATNDDDTFYEFGDYDLPFTKPNLETVIDFMNSIDEINNAIVEYNKKLDELNNKKFKIE